MFENYSKLTGPELAAFNKFLFKRNTILYVALSIMLCLIGAFIIWVRVDTFDIVMGIISVVLGLATYPLLLLVSKIAINKSIKKTEVMFSKNYIIHTTFNENDFIYDAIVDEKIISTTTWEYKNIYKIDEDEQYMFIMFSKVQALIINKNGFIDDNYSNFKKFITYKILGQNK